MKLYVDVIRLSQQEVLYNFIIKTTGTIKWEISSDKRSQYQTENKILTLKAPGGKRNTEYKDSLLIYRQLSI